MDPSFLAFLHNELPLHIQAFLLGIARLHFFLHFSPIFGVQKIRAISLPLAIALYLPLHPYLYDQASLLSLADVEGFIFYMVLIAKEAVIGLLLAFITMSIFYSVLCAGTIIDQQRGASMAQTADPLAGAETSPLGLVFYFGLVVLFFVSGAFMHFVQAFYSTYMIWSPFEALPSLLDANLSTFTLHQLDILMTQTLLLCGPFLIIALMCDLALGLINRFSPQLNVFILSMPIKSGVCAFLLLLYITPFLNFGENLFALQISLIEQLKHVLGASIPAA